MKSWKRFELLVARIHSYSIPNAIIQHNHKVIGKSGRPRQLDITVSQKIGPYPILVVIECKQYKKAVGIEKVEAFATKMRDVSASHGVIVSARGFDEGARAVAKQYAITLLSYKEADEVDWREALGEESWAILTWDQTELHSVQVYNNQIEYETSPETRLIDTDSSNTITLIELVRALTEQVRKLRSFCSFELEMTSEEGLAFFIEDKPYPLNKLVIIGRNLVVGIPFNLVFYKGHLLFDELKQEKMFQQYITDSFDWVKFAEANTSIELTDKDLEEIKGKTKSWIHMPPRDSENRDVRFFITRFKAS